jgi:hypothetical protein
VHDRFADGVWFVSLASLTDPDLVIPTIAQTLGVSEQGDWPLAARLQHWPGERELDDRRRAWLNRPGTPEAELKKRTLTNLYNERPAWLAMAHAKLDRAVWDAYGWDDPDPAGVDDDTLLARLLALNLERAGPVGAALLAVSAGLNTDNSGHDDGPDDPT